jgi:hypothetical protein
MEIKVVYISFPDLTISPVMQYYTLLRENIWLFEQPADNFSSTITVDAIGLVSDYPGLFQRNL